MTTTTSNETSTAALPSEGEGKQRPCEGCKRKRRHAEWCPVFEQKVMLAGLSNLRIMKAKRAK